MSVRKNNDRSRLRDFLKQYSLAVSERERLENQKKSLEKAYTFNGDIVGVSMITADIQKQIDKQIRYNAILLVQIKDVLNYLPDNSLQRKILDARYVDGMNWVQIERHFNYSEASVKRYEADGIDELLEYERVRALIRNK